MSTQVAEAEAEDDPPIIFGRGTRTAVLFVLDNHAVLRRETKTKLFNFDFSIDFRNKLDDMIVGSEATNLW